MKNSLSKILAAAAVVTTLTGCGTFTKVKYVDTSFDPNNPNAAPKPVVAAPAPVVAKPDVVQQPSVISPSRYLSAKPLVLPSIKVSNSTSSNDPFAEQTEMLIRAYRATECPQLTSNDDILNYLYNDTVKRVSHIDATVAKRLQANIENGTKGVVPVVVALNMAVNTEAKVARTLPEPTRDTLTALVEKTLQINALEKSDLGMYVKRQYSAPKKAREQLSQSLGNRPVVLSAPAVSLTTNSVAH